MSPTDSARRSRGFLAALALGAALAGASCSSTIKGQSREFDRGPDGARPVLDLSPYVKNRDQAPSGAVPADLVQQPDKVAGRQKWQNFKLWPRNFKFAVAIAPLVEGFRRLPPDGNDLDGEPRDNIATRTLDTPVEDDGTGADGNARAPAILPDSDRSFVVQSRAVSDQGTAVAPPDSSSTGAATPPVEAPATPAETPPKPSETPPAVTPEDDGPRPARVGMARVPEHRFAATSPQDPGAGDAAAPKAAETQDAARRRHLHEISDKEGVNFPIDSDKFQERMKQVLSEFLVFEKVEPIKYGDDQKSLEGLYRQADARKDDFLLVCTLRRNKVSYDGVDYGPAIVDNLIEFLFLFNDVWSPIHREQYECDVELFCQLYDVRSHHKVLEQTFEGNDTLVLSTAQRTWHPMRNWLSWLKLDNTESVFYDAGVFVRPGAWMDMEVKLLDTFQNALKAELDDERFDTETNRFHDDSGNVTKLPPRQLALVAAITDYGPQAQPKLAEWAAEDANTTAEAAEKDLVKLYEGQPVKLGTRPYAEEDARKIVKDLLDRPGALESSAGVLATNLYAKLGKDATIAELRDSFRQIARARQDDHVFVYLNGETLVLDDPSKPDGSTNYFLPYDIDLGEVDRLWKQDRAKVKPYLDEHALSFDWIEACFYRDSPADHIFLQSRHTLMIVDCTFPGQFTRERFCPGRIERARHRMLPGAGAGNYLIQPDGTGPRPPEKAPVRAPEKKPDETPPQPPKDEKKDEKPADQKPAEPKPPEKPAEPAPPPEDEGPRPNRVGFVSPSRFRPTTVLAQAEPATVGSGGISSVSTEQATQITSTSFLERIAQGGQGRFVVLTTAPEELSLDIPSLKQGGFIYYFTQFLDPTKQARFARYRNGQGAVPARGIVDYATDRLESESRQAGRPQHVKTFGDTEREYILLGSQR